MANKTLLEKAKEIRAKTVANDYLDEEIDLAIAWMKGEIRLIQATRVLGLRPSGTVGNKIANFLREGYRRGKIKIGGE
jgi:hypothetical protein